MTAEQIKEFEEIPKKLIKVNQGDQAAFYLKLVYWLLAFKKIRGDEELTCVQRPRPLRVE